MADTKKDLIAAADVKLAAANERYRTERTTEARTALLDASRERSALGPATNYRPGSRFANQAGRRQLAERRALETRRRK